MPTITTFDVTYGAALAPAGYHRATLEGGGSANLSISDKNAAAGQSFLWYSYLPTKFGPIIDIQILYDDESTPAGFEKLPRALVNTSEGRTSYLCTRKAYGGFKEYDSEESNLQPLSEIFISYSKNVVHEEKLSEKNSGTMWEMLSRSLSPEADVFLWFRRIPLGHASSWTAFDLENGDFLDIIDKGGHWHAAQVVASTPDTITVRYDGWDSKWNETFPRSSTKLAEHLSRADAASSPRKIQPNFIQVDNIMELEAQIHDAVAGSLEDEFTQRILFTDLPAYIENIMVSRYENPQKDLPAVNDLLQLGLEVVTHMLSLPGAQFPDSLLRILLHVGICDDECGEMYYKFYGRSPLSKDALNWPVRSPQLPGIPYMPEEPEFKSLDQGLLVPYSSLNQEVTVWKSNVTSPLWYINIQHFHSCRGYLAILKRLTEPSNVCRLIEVNMYVRFMHVTRQFYDLSAGRGYFEKLKELVDTRLQRLTVEELKEAKDASDKRTMALLDRVLSELKVLWPEVIPKFNLAEFTEKMHVSICLQLLACPLLGPQIRGIILLGSICTATMQLEQRPHSLSSSYFRPSSTYYWITASWLSQWLSDHGAVELALGDQDITPGPPTPRKHPPKDLIMNAKKTSKAHIEVLKRSEPILQLMANQKKFTMRHMDLLWAAGVGQQDAQQRCVYSLTVQLVPRVGGNILARICAHACALAPSLEERHVEFIQDFARAAATSLEVGYAANDPLASNVLTDTLNVLWNVAQDNSPSIGSLAAEALAHVLYDAARPIHTGARSVRLTELLRLINLCVKGIQEGKNTIVSLRVLKMLMEAQQSAVAAGRSNGGYAKEHLLMNLAREHRIIDIIIDDLESYRSRVKNVLEQSDNSMMDIIFEGREMHSTQILNRLEFLKFMAEYSPTPLEFATLKSLWGSFVKNYLCPMESSTFLHWLTTVVPRDRSIGGIYVTMNAETAKRVLSELLCKDANWERLQVEGYKCFERYFRVVNLLSERGGDFIVDRLIGWPTLWKVVCEASEDQSVTLAGRFLVNLHLSLMATQPEERKELVVLFVKRCMELIEENRSTMQKWSTTVLCRVLLLLKLFLKEAALSFRKSDPFTTAKAGGEMRVTVQQQVGRGTNYLETLPIPAKLGPPENLRPVTMGQLRAITARTYSTPGNQVHISVGQRPQVSPDKDSLVLAEIPSQAYNPVVAILLKEPCDYTIGWNPPLHARADAIEMPRNPASPTEQLSNKKEYFELLLSLSEYESSEVADAAWDLLCTLPINTKIHNELRNLSNSIRLPSDAAALECFLSVPEKQIRGFYGYNCLEPVVEKLDWNRILPGGSVVMLLYRLRALSSIMLSAVDEHALPGDREDAKALRSALVEKGGVSHMFNLLGGKNRVQFDSTRKLHKACLASLLELSVSLALSFTLNEPSKPDSPSRSKMHKGNDSSSSSDDDSENIHTSIDINNDTNGKSWNLSDLLDEVEPRELMQRALVLMAEVTRTVTTGSDNDLGVLGEDEKWVSAEAEVVQHTMSLLTTLTLENPSLLEVVLNFEGLPDTLHYGLLEVPQVLVRKQVANGIYAMAQRHLPNSPRLTPYSGPRTDPAHFFLSLLLRSLSTGLQSEKRSCMDYFDLMVKLVRLPNSMLQDERDTVCMTVGWEIRNREMVEDSENDEDMPLRGCLLFLRYAIESCEVERLPNLCRLLGTSLFDSKTGLIHELFHSCLFAHTHFESAPYLSQKGGADMKPGASPKCKSRSLRRAAFSLLAVLARGDPLTFQLCASLCSSHHAIGLTPEQRAREKVKEDRRRRRVSRIVPVSGAGSMRTDSIHRPGVDNRRVARGYCGLKNLGCICYMNATIQQLFMTPRFRESVLAFDGEADIPVDEREESFMWQLQVMFGHLQESDKAHYNPIGFCHAMRDWDNQPIDVLMQQDASEFVAVFLQQLEGKVMGSPVETPLRETFGGIFSNELLAPGGKRSERPEPFSTISVAVKDVRTLNAALENFVAGETVDYRWGEGESAQTLATLKRLSIRDLPPHLIIHLKRFEFDFGSMQQVKINDRFEFPMELDMKPFMTEARADQIKSEVGDLLGGEDTEIGPDSRANNQRPDSYYRYQLAGVVVHMGTANSGHYYSFIRERCGSRRWFEFNDNIVTEFDPAELEVECFGGTRQRSANVGGGNHSWLSDRNAFMLVYDRVSTSEIAPIDPSQASKREYSTVPEPTMRFRAPVPPAIMEEIHIENFEFWHKRNIQNTQYYSFLKDLILGKRAWEGSIPPEGLMLGLKFALGTLQQAGHYERVPDWCRVLGDMIKSSPEVSAWLLHKLQKDTAALYDIVLSPHLCRVDAVNLLSAAVTCDVTATLRDRMSLISEAVSTEFISTLLNTLPKLQCEGYWRYMGDFFSLIYAYAAVDSIATILLLENGVLARLLSFLMQESTPYPELVPGSAFQGVFHPQSMGGTLSSEEVDYTSFSKLLGHLLCACNLYPLSNAIGILEIQNENDEIEIERLRTEMTADEKAAAARAPSVWASIDPLWDLPLDSPEAEMLTSPSLITRILKGAFLPSRRSPMAMVLRHISWRSRPFTRLIVKYACEGIKCGNTRDDLKPYFCALAALLGTESNDGLCDWRTGWTMRHLLETMVGQNRYIRATEASINLLLRLAEAVPEARAWLSHQANSDGLEWIVKFLHLKEMPGIKSSFLRMDKPYSPPYYGSGGNCCEYWGANRAPSNRRSHTGAATLQLPTSMNFIDIVKNKNNVVESYHSDLDPEEVIGRDINLILKSKTSVNSSKEIAKIISYKRGEHQILLASEDEPRSVNLFETGFEFK